MINLIIVALAALMMAFPALAADWVYIAKSDDGIITSYLDKSTISKANNSTWFWVKTLAKGTPGFEMSRFWIDCSTREYGILETIKYDTKGRVLETLNESGVYLIAPETMIEAKYFYVCFTEPEPEKDWVDRYNEQTEKNEWKKLMVP